MPYTVSDAAVSSRTMVTFVTWFIFRTEFLVQKVLYNAILFKKLSRACKEN